jgi:hypothetical protein
MALKKILENASAPAEGKLTSSIYEFLDSNPRQLFIGGEIGEAIITVEMSPNGAATWFPMATVTVRKVLQMQAQAGVQLRLTLARDQNAKVNAWI